MVTKSSFFLCSFLVTRKRLLFPLKIGLTFIKKKQSKYVSIKSVNYWFSHEECFGCYWKFMCRKSAVFIVLPTHFKNNVHLNFWWWKKGDNVNLVFWIRINKFKKVRIFLTFSRKVHSPFFYVFIISKKCYRLFSCIYYACIN